MEQQQPSQIDDVIQTLRRDGQLIELTQALIDKVIEASGRYASAAEANAADLLALARAATERDEADRLVMLAERFREIAERERGDTSERTDGRSMPPGVEVTCREFEIAPPTQEELEEIFDKLDAALANARKPGRIEVQRATPALN